MNHDIFPFRLFQIGSPPLFKCSNASKGGEASELDSKQTWVLENKKRLSHLEKAHLLRMLHLIFQNGYPFCWNWHLAYSRLPGFNGPVPQPL
jgi:hypothetical protein